MSDGMPPGGWPMRMALYTLQLEKWAQTARRYQALERSEPEDMLRYNREFLWLELIQRAHRGEVVFRGVKPDADEPTLINPGLLSGSSKPDFAGDQLETAGRTYHAVSVFPAEAVHTTPAPASALGTLEAIYESGAPGRPTSIHLCLAEMRARHGRGEMAPNVSKEARHLSGWLLTAHPLAHPATQSTVENGIRAEYRALKPPPKR